MADKDDKKTTDKTKQPAAQAKSEAQAQPAQPPAQPQAQAAVRQGTARPQRPPAQHVLGEVVWLLSQSKTHKHFRMEDLNWFAMPPIMLEQYRIFLGRQQNPQNPQQQAEVPMGVAFWAMLSKEVERRFTEAVKDGSGPVQLRPQDWNSGNRLWLIELVAPFATEENRQVQMMMDDFLKNGLLQAFQKAKDHKVKFFQTDKETGERKIVELQAQFSVAQDQPANDGGASA